MTKQNDILCRLISDCVFSGRTANAFKYNGIHTLGDLLSLSEELLLSIPNFGKKSLAEVKVWLENERLFLAKRTSLLKDKPANEKTPIKHVPFKWTETTTESIEWDGELDSIPDGLFDAVSEYVLSNCSVHVSMAGTIDLSGPDGYNPIAKSTVQERLCEMTDCYEEDIINNTSGCLEIVKRTYQELNNNLSRLKSIIDKAK